MMKDFSIGDRCRYAEMIVIIRSLRRKDGKYLVEDESHAFFPIAGDKLTPIEEVETKGDEHA